MKNLINSDSLHRVEPSARYLSEQLQKHEAEQSYSQKSLQNEMTQKSRQPNPAEGPDNSVDGDSPKKKEEGPRKKSGGDRSGKNTSAPGKPRYFGGQLLDKEG